MYGRIIPYIVLAMVAASARAQYPVGADGRALDANLQVGSQGMNPTGRSLRPGAYQDALVTGNIGGLHRFRGNVDYRAPGEFSGHTSADDTYRFRLQSLPAAARDPALALPAERPLLLRAGSGVTTGEVTGQAQRLGAPATTLRRDDLPGLAVRREGMRTAASLDSAAIRLRTQVADPAAPDLRGRSLETIRVSPLTGVRNLQPLQPAPPPWVPGEDESWQDRRRHETLRLRQALPPAAPTGEPFIRADETPDARSVERSRRQMELAEQARQPLLLGGARPDAQDPAETEGDAYRSRQARGAVIRPGDTLGGAERKNPGPRLSPDEELAARADALLRGAPGDLSDDAAFERLIGQIDGQQPALRTLASGSGSDYDLALVTAERLMSEGKYLEAESAYARAIAMPRSTPLAWVGHAHAQIGAGLHAAAAASLRRLFLRHPQLIAARYAPPVLPDPQRLDEVRQELQDLRQASGRPDVALPAAYLAYQHGDPQAAHQALDDMAAKDQRDPLVPLLRRAWTAPAPAAEERPQDQ